MEDNEKPNAVRLVHHLPGRTRLRLHWSRSPRVLSLEEANRLADQLTKVPAVTEVQVNRYTGGVLVLHEARLEPSELVQKCREISGAERVLGPEEQPVVERAPLAAHHTPAVARALAHAFRGLNRDVLQATGGTLDLGTLATFGFVGAGAMDVIVNRKMPAPPWFNLAWWGFRTFMTLEKNAIRAELLESEGTEELNGGAREGGGAEAP